MLLMERLHSLLSLIRYHMFRHESLFFVMIFCVSLLIYKACYSVRSQYKHRLIASPALYPCLRYGSETK